MLKHVLYCLKLVGLTDILNKCKLDVRSYVNRNDELSVEGNIILWGHRVVI